MTNYTINPTEPLRSTFIIRPYTSNGNRFPTSSVANQTSTLTSSVLLLYGKGHPEYGERTDENLLHLAENFSGASPPVLDASGNTTVGVLWHREYLYQWDGGANWYQYANGSWSAATVTTGLLATRPATAVDGALYYATDTLQLFRYSNDERGLQQWVERVWETGTGTGTPTRELVVNHDGTSSGWNVIVSSSGGALDTQYLRLDTTNGPLRGDLTLRNESGNPTLTIDANLGSPSSGRPLIDLVGDSATIRLRGATNWSIADNPTGGANGTLEIRVGNTPGTNVYFEVDQDSGVLFARGDTAAAYAAAMQVGSPDDDQAIPNKFYVDTVIGGAAVDGYVTGGSFTSGTLTLTVNGDHPSTPSFDIVGFTANNITFINIGSPDFTVSEQGVQNVESALTVLDNTKLTLTALSGFVIQTVENPVEFTEQVEVLTPISGDPSSFATNKEYVVTTPYNRALFVADGSPNALRGPAGTTALITGSPDEVIVTLPWRYYAGTNRLSIYQNGQKLLQTSTGYQDWSFAPGIGTDKEVTGLPSYSVVAYDGSPAGFVLDSSLGDVSSDFSAGDSIRVDNLIGSPFSIEYTVVGAGATFDGTNTIVFVGGSPFTPPNPSEVDPNNTILGINYTFIVNLNGAGNVEVGVGAEKINGNDISTGGQLLARINTALIDTFGSNTVDAFFLNDGIRFRSLASTPPSTISVTNGPSTTSDLWDASNLGVDGALLFPSGAEEGLGQFAYEEVKALGGSPFAYAPVYAGETSDLVRITTPVSPGDVFEFISTPR